MTSLLVNVRETLFSEVLNIEAYQKRDQSLIYAITAAFDWFIASETTRYNRKGPPRVIGPKNEISVIFE